MFDLKPHNAKSDIRVHRMQPFPAVASRVMHCFSNNSWCLHCADYTCTFKTTAAKPDIRLMDTLPGDDALWMEW